MPTGVPKIWKDQNGKVWRIPEMSHIHLMNAIGKMARNHQTYIPEYDYMVDEERKIRGVSKAEKVTPKLVANPNVVSLHDYTETSYDHGYDQGFDDGFDVGVAYAIKQMRDVTDWMEEGEYLDD